MELDFPKHPDLAREVSAYLEAHNMPRSTFSKNATGDPSFINSMVRGRELRADTLRAVRFYMLTGRRATAEDLAK